MSWVLRGLRVRERGTSPTVAYVGRLLAGLGAQVLVDGKRGTDTKCSFLNRGKCFGLAHEPYDIVITDRRSLLEGEAPTLQMVISPPIEAPLGTVGCDLPRYLVGTFAAACLLIAVRQRLRGDPTVSISLEVCEEDALAWLLAPGAPLATRDSREAPRDGRLVRCSDGYVWLAFPTPAHWNVFQAAAGVPDLETARGEHEQLARIDAWAARRSRSAIVRRLQRLRLPVAPVLRPAEAVHDPQFRARGFLRRDECSSPATILGGPFRSRQLRWGAPPAVGVTWTWPTQGEDEPSSSGRPLADTRVLDLGSMWAGPQTGVFLAALGADVVKVEHPRRPDGTRAGPQRTFAALNGGKRGLACDLSDPPQRDSFLGLLRTADVVVENFSPRVMPQLGLAPEHLALLNPRLVYLSMPAYGRTGPWRQYVAYGDGLACSSGVAALHFAANGGEPAVCGVPIGDPVAAATGMFAIAAGLLRQARQGKGAVVEVAQREALASLIGPFLVNSSLADAGCSVSPAYLSPLSPPSARGTWAHLPIYGLRSLVGQTAPSLGEHTVEVVSQWLSAPAARNAHV